MRMTDAEVLQAAVDKSSFRIRLVAETAALGRLLSSFHSDLDELTLIALPPAPGETSGAVQLHSHTSPVQGEA